MLVIAILFLPSFFFKLIIAKIVAKEGSTIGNPSLREILKSGNSGKVAITTKRKAINDNGLLSPIWSKTTKKIRTAGMVRTKLNMNEIMANEGFFMFIV